MNIYDRRRAGTILFLIATLIVVGLFLYVSNNLVRDLSTQERERMQIWADATKEIISIGQNQDDPERNATDIEFLLSIIERNHTIPVLLTDDNGTILLHRNFDLPEPPESGDDAYILSEINSRFSIANSAH